MDGVKRIIILSLGFSLVFALLMIYVFNEDNIVVYSIISLQAFMILSCAYLDSERQFSIRKLILTSVVFGIIIVVFGWLFMGLIVHIYDSFGLKVPFKSIPAFIPITRALILGIVVFPILFFLTPVVIYLMMRKLFWLRKK